MSDQYKAFVVALAAPIVRGHGGEETTLGGGIDPKRARHLLETLFLVKTKDDAVTLLGSFAQHGQRAEWTQYSYHAGGAWKPDPHDQSVVRKAEYATAHKAELGERGLLAFDAMRSSAIAGWCVAAGIFSEPEALSAIGVSLVRAVAEKHASWDEAASQIRLAFGFTAGAVPPEVESALAALSSDGLWSRTPWPSVDKLAAPRTKGGAVDEHDEDDEDDETEEDTEADDPSLDVPGARTVVAIALSIDCEGCSLQVSFPAFAEREQCGHCGVAGVVPAEMWKLYLERNLKHLRTGADGYDPITNDFGKQHFSRRWVQKVASVTCPCGAALPTPEAPGDLACGSCGRVSVVRATSAADRGMAARARLVVTPPVAPARPATSTTCARCDAPVTDLSARIARCNGCGGRTFVDDATWRAAHGPSVRPKTYVLFAW